MTEQNETQYLADAFSERVARDFPRAVWLSLFVDCNAAARLQAATWSVVCADSGWDGRMSEAKVRATLGGLATSHGGHLDAGPGATCLAAFADPDDALRTALALQRETADASVRIGVVTVHAGLAQFRVEGAAVNLLVGGQLARAAELLQRAASGSVQLCAITYGALAGFSPELDACVVMAEYEDTELTRVALTPPPVPGVFLSTFAGLGLT